MVAKLVKSWGLSDGIPEKLHTIRSNLFWIMGKKSNFENISKVLDGSTNQKYSRNFEVLYNKFVINQKAPKLCENTRL